MKVWVACVVVFFGVAELYQWFQQVTLPFPVYGIAGLLLAIISNRHLWLQFQAQSQFSNHSGLPRPFNHSATGQLDSPSETQFISPAMNSAPQSATDSPDPASLCPQTSSPQLPDFTPPTRPSISFTIHKAK